MAIQAQFYNSENNGLLNSSQNSCWIDNNVCGAGGGGGGGGGSAAGNGGYNQFCYDFQLQKSHELQQKQLLQQQQNQEQSMFLQNHSHILKNNINRQYQSVNNNQSITGYIEKQKQEVDRFLRNQNEKLISFLQEQKKQQFAMICRKIDEKASLLLKQKDEELAKAANRTMELENLLRKMEMENQAWQRAATENEAMVVSLSNSLEQLVEKISYEGFNNNGGAEDAESICDENIIEEDEEETGENRGGVSEGIMMPLCKGCNSRNSCVLFLPCRHLCSCMACEAFLDSCPVCTTIKRSSILALT